MALHSNVELIKKGNHHSLVLFKGCGSRVKLMKMRHAFFAEVFHMAKTENKPEENMEEENRERKRKGRTEKLK